MDSSMTNSAVESSLTSHEHSRDVRSLFYWFLSVIASRLNHTLLSLVCTLCTRSCVEIVMICCLKRQLACVLVFVISCSRCFVFVMLCLCSCNICCSLCHWFRSDWYSQFSSFRPVLTRCYSFIKILFVVFIHITPVTGVQDAESFRNTF